MKKIVIYSLLASALLLSACSNKLDVIGNYKETMVVYGLLDQSQPKQYIKINKAFLGEGSATQFAQIKDSTTYGTNVLSVVLQRIKNGVQQGADIPLLADNTILKNTGTFSAPDQSNAIYSTSTTLFSDSDYKLIIKNTQTGIIVSSQTSLLTNATYTSPNLTGPSSTFTFIKQNTDNFAFRIEWNSGANARLYQTIVRFHYIDSTLTGNVIDSVDWVSIGQKTQTLAGGEAMSNDFAGQSFLQFIGNRLSVYPGLINRTSGKVDVILVAAGDDLSTFIDVNAPSTGIIQERPEFTNITNGLGIFSARYYKAPVSKFMDGTGRDSLACGRYTKNLKFVGSLGVDAFGNPAVARNFCRFGIKKALQLLVMLFFMP